MMPPPVIEAMSRAAYESTCTPSFPAWDAVTEGYRADMRKPNTAAIRAAEGEGWRLVRSDEAGRAAG